MGRLMKKSTKSTLPFVVPPHVSAALVRGCYGLLRAIGSADRLNWRPVNKELSTGDDDLFPGRQTAIDGIIVADGIAESYCALLGNAPVLRLSRPVNKRLPSNE